MEKLCAPERDNGCSAASCRARGEKIGTLLRNDEREYERDKTDGELERGWEGGRKRGWRRREGEGNGGEGSVLRASRPNPALPSHHANCTTVG